MRKTRRRTGRRRWATLAAVALVPLALFAASATPASPVPEHGGFGGGWAGSFWMGTTPTSGTGTTLADVRKIIGADATKTAAALTGKGVGVAQIDTGVAAVAGLPPAQIVNGPDLSFESQAPNLRYLDSYGHGTHLAGIVVANDTVTGTKGLAPMAKLTSLKLGTANGAVDVTQVIAAIDWVVEHKNDDTANPIRVLNLAYSSGGTVTDGTDALHFAVEQAWKAGIVVVVSAGNDGASGLLPNPAIDPYVLTVGATSTNGTLATSDDAMASFSAISSSHKQVDVLAPGQSIVSLRVPGSNVDNQFPGARVGETLFRGSGTSQAAAVASATVALLLQSRPSLTPDQVKDVLKRGTPVGGTAASLGVKQLHLATALGLTPSTTAKQTWPYATGTGSLNAARGSSILNDGSTPLVNDNMIMGPLNMAAWKARAGAVDAWRGGLWMDYRMAGDGWTGTSFASKTWAAAAWPPTPWSGTGSWTDPAWSGRSWAGRSWAGGEWTGRYWSSQQWSTSTWG